MSGLKAEIAARSRALVKREVITLPDAGVRVQVRGMMAGEIRRTMEAKRSEDVQIAIACEDPDTGEQIWNPNDFNDLEAIAALSAVDQAVLLMASNRLSGAERLGKLRSPQTENGSSSSHPDSGEPSTS